MWANVANMAILLILTLNADYIDIKNHGPSHTTKISNHEFATG